MDQNRSINGGTVTRASPICDLEVGRISNIMPITNKPQDETTGVYPSLGNEQGTTLHQVAFLVNNSVRLDLDSLLCPPEI